MTRRSRRGAIAPAIAAAMVLAAAAPARAVEFEVFVNVANAEELRDAFIDGLIDEDSYLELLDLLSLPVDLNVAGRDDLYSLPNLSYADVDRLLLYRGDVGRIVGLGDLSAAGVLSAEQVAALVPFVQLQPPARRLAVTGRLRVRAAGTVGDDLAPPATLELRLRTFDHLQVGAATLHGRTDVRDVRYDPARDALSAQAPGSQLAIPKFNVAWRDAHRDLVAGTYRTGFFERLVFDNTGRAQPNGAVPDDTIERSSDLTLACKETAGELDDSPCAGAAGDRRITPDFHAREGLQGVAVSLRDLGTGAVRADVHTFVSVLALDVNQFQLVRADRCADPRDDDDPGCAAPDVFVRDADEPLAPTSRVLYQTLPDVVRETVAGAALAVRPTRRLSVGAAAYAAWDEWLVEGAELDFQEWATRPQGGRFGAAGATVGWHQGWADLAFEVAHSSDNDQRGGGGPAVVARHTATWGTHELELSGRCFGAAFANPFARPIAAADQFDGNRARDEAGGRLRYAGRFGDWSLRALLDLWHQPRAAIPQGQAYVRSDFAWAEFFVPALWLDWRDKDLGSSGRGHCFQGDETTEVADEPESCRGEQYKLTLRARFPIDRRLSLTMQGQQSWLDDRAYDGAFQQNRSAWLGVLSKPYEPVRVRGRVRYADDDVRDVGRGQRLLWGTLDVTWRLPVRLDLHARYDQHWFLDDRAATADREPNPEHSMYVETVWTF